MWTINVIIKLRAITTKRILINENGIIMIIIEVPWGNKKSKETRTWSEEINLSATLRTTIFIIFII